MATHMTQAIKNNWKIALLLAMWAIVTLFLVSPDSYTHDLYQRNNSAWFFMCGKAWMNGMVPYVDFSDSKGPLLWLVYGMGYLLSHYNYVGVFWITCVLYTVVFFFVYKLAFLFLNNKRQSMLCTIVMTLFFFNGLYHREIKSEDIAQPFMMGAIYFTSLLLYGGEANGKTVKRSMMWLGLCFGATFLIKYNMALISVTFIVYALIALRRDGHKLLPAMGWLGAGVAVVWTPFLLYFIISGNLQAFAFEYFVNVFHTVSKVGTQGDNLIDGLFTKLIVNAVPLTVQSIATLSPLVIIYMKRLRSFPLVAFVVAAVINCGNGVLIYYFNNINGLVTFGVISLIIMARNHKHHPWPRYAMPMVMGFVLLTATLINNDRGGNYFTQNGTRRSIFYYYASLMTQVKNPSIVYYRCMPNPEFGVVNNALPGCKYWALQAGATKAMFAEQDRAVENRKPDFVAVGVGDKKSIGKLTALGYHSHKHSSRDNIFVLFSKQQLVEVPEDIEVSNLEVLSKAHFTRERAMQALPTQQKKKMQQIIN